MASQDKFNSNQQSEIDEDIPITARGRFFEDDFFQQARDRFRRQMHQFRQGSWDEEDVFNSGRKTSQDSRTASMSFRQDSADMSSSNQRQGGEASFRSSFSSQFSDSSSSQNRPRLETRMSSSIRDDPFFDHDRSEIDRIVSDFFGDDDFFRPRRSSRSARYFTDADQSACSTSSQQSKEEHCRVLSITAEGNCFKVNRLKFILIKHHVSNQYHLELKA